MATPLEPDGQRRGFRPDPGDVGSGLGTVHRALLRAVFLRDAPSRVFDYFLGPLVYIDIP